MLEKILYYMEFKRGLFLLFRTISLASISLLSKVTSIFNHKHIIPDDNGFNIESFLEIIPSDSVQFEKLYERIKQSGLIGNLVSKDFKTMCFVGRN